MWFEIGERGTFCKKVPLSPNPLPFKNFGVGCCKWIANVFRVYEMHPSQIFHERKEHSVKVCL